MVVLAPASLPSVPLKLQIYGMSKLAAQCLLKTMLQANELLHFDCFSFSFNFFSYIFT